NAQMVWVVTLVHIHGHDAVFRARQFDDLVRFDDVEAHGLLGDDVDAFCQRGQNDGRVQMVRGGDGHDVEIGEIAEDLAPGSRAEISACCVTEFGRTSYTSPAL